MHAFTLPLIPSRRGRGIEGALRERSGENGFPARAAAHREDVSYRWFGGFFPGYGHPPRTREMNMTGLYCQPPWTTMLTTGFFSSAWEKVYS